MFSELATATDLWAEGQSPTPRLTQLIILSFRSVRDDIGTYTYSACLMVNSRECTPKSDIIFYVFGKLHAFCAS